jgi:5-methylcytosine-specific restriction endonuclease McrA
MTTKLRIPKALREQVWLKTNKQVFKVKCLISWCQNKINVFDFHVGHIIPESKGGATTISNLTPICARCNLSMSNTYTITQFSNEFAETHKSIWMSVRLVMIKLWFTAQVVLLLIFCFIMYLYI